MLLFEKLGIVTNIWTKRMEGGDRFEDLARQFGDQGFKDMEVREGDYLRNSEFGSLIGEIEASMEALYRRAVEGDLRCNLGRGARSGGYSGG